MNYHEYIAAFNRYLNNEHNITYEEVRLLHQQFCNVEFKHEKDTCDCGHDQFVVYCCYDRIAHNGSISIVCCAKCGKRHGYLE